MGNNKDFLCNYNGGFCGFKLRHFRIEAIWSHDTFMSLMLALKIKMLRKC